jgi:endonuclease YncB( thermonuclease family)
LVVALRPHRDCNAPTPRRSDPCPHRLRRARRHHRWPCLGERIRILHVDAPERGQLCFKKLQSIDEGAWPCGLQAALALSDWIGEKTVTCETTTQETTDLFRIWLARCVVAGQDVAEWLAARGWAVPDRKCKCDEIRDAAQNARAAQLAIWTSAFTMPWEWRGEQGD